jgi:hypothetical protein
VPKKEALKNKILDEAHMSRYSIHSGSTKMYHDLRHQFGCIRMKRETTHYVSECYTCQKVKADYMQPGDLLQHGDLLQPLSIPDWKWDDISMDFIMGLPLTARKFNSIWVIVHRLTKSAHFIPVNTNYNVQKYAEIYIARMLCLHGVLKTIISNQGSQLFGATAHVPRGSLDSQFSLLPSDGWPTRESQPNSRRYAQSLCDEISG